MVLALLCLANVRYFGNLLILCVIYVCRCCVYKHKSMCACVGIYVFMYIHYIHVLDVNTWITLIYINELIKIPMHVLVYIHTHTPLYYNNGIKSTLWSMKMPELQLFVSGPPAYLSLYLRNRLAHAVAQDSWWAAPAVRSAQKVGPELSTSLLPDTDMRKSYFVSDAKWGNKDLGAVSTVFRIDPNFVNEKSRS